MSPYTCLSLTSATVLASTLPSFLHSTRRATIAMMTSFGFSLLTTQALTFEQAVPVETQTCSHVKIVTRAIGLTYNVSISLVGASEVNTSG